MQDVLRHEEEAKGRETRQHLQFILLTIDQLDDVMAALAFLKILPGIDSRRIAVAGHSFEGQLTLLAAERDKTIRAAVTFAGAASSWDRSPELRERLLSAMRGSSAATMLTYAENDFATAAGRLGGGTGTSAQAICFEDISSGWPNVGRRSQHVVRKYPCMGIRCI
jgi:dienelactone hydrolase